ncbi:hypothetical protein PC129_g6455 [Phytophthora cactorum]|uniref:Uncharacterized protein n=1 Tax=Phytophthora cactorum TaxID=29920 RepID=A0A8T1ICU5_9STRA|nr:hypothetical protein PC129_g6455 [Phytophthora cactorum]
MQRAVRVEGTPLETVCCRREFSSFNALSSLLHHRRDSTSRNNPARLCQQGQALTEARRCWHDPQTFATQSRRHRIASVVEW